MKTVILVQNLRCGGCAKTIKDKLNKLDGISDVVVDIEKHKVSFIATTENVVQNVSRILTQLGYPEAKADNSITLKARSVLSCASGKMLK